MATIHKSPNTTGRPFHSRQWIYDADGDGVKEGNDSNFASRNNATCPDIGTGVYSSEDVPKSPVVWGEPNVKIFNSAGTQITDGSRKNLRWRFTVKGRSQLMRGASDQPKGPDYICTYDYDVELLHGGEGWEVGDYVQFSADATGFDPVSYTHLTLPTILLV